MKYAFISEHCDTHAVVRLCSALDVSVSGYNDWLKRPMSATQKENQRLQTKIRCFHKASRSIYGSPRIHRDLIDSGENVSRPRVARIMRTEGNSIENGKEVYRDN